MAGTKSSILSERKQISYTDVLELELVLMCVCWDPNLDSLQ